MVAEITTDSEIVSPKGFSVEYAVVGWTSRSINGERERAHARTKA